MAAFCASSQADRCVRRTGRCVLLPLARCLAARAAADRGSPRVGLCSRADHLGNGRTWPDRSRPTGAIDRERAVIAGGVERRLDADPMSFVLGAAMERARTVLAEDRLLRLTTHEVNQLEEVLDSEPEVGPQLKAFIRRISKTTRLPQDSSDRHRQFGVLVTTSRVDAQAYREIRETTVILL